jgi:hypothetical protein
MPTVEIELTVENLIAAIEQLPPDELHKLERRFDELRKQNGKAFKTDADLIRATKENLQPKERRRLKQLIAKSESQTLKPAELIEYRQLAQKSEQIMVRRMKALVELTERWGKAVEVVMKEIGWESGTDAA